MIDWTYVGTVVLPIVTFGIGFLTTLFSAYIFARNLSSYYVMKNKDKHITI